eukprot:Colp12_sorted_trinity150504_noHs@14580
MLAQTAAPVGSVLNFHSVASLSAEAVMENELHRLLKLSSDPELFKKEVDGFLVLFKRFLAEKNATIDWNKIKPPSAGTVTPYSEMNAPEDTDVKELLSKLVVLKLNGGLGTSMGCTGPKSAIEVRDDMTFLDLTVRQIEQLNERYDADVPLLLMNSFNTHEETERIIQKYANNRVNILTFNQSKYPRFYKDSLLPVPKGFDNKNDWYPPGHGDVYEALQNSGLLETLIRQGKEYVFVSNVDNLGATVDINILHHLLSSPKRIEFLMEVTDKTIADVKGGTLIEYEGAMRLLEIAQVPSQHVDEFKSIKKFRIFNTNNLWMDLKAVQRNVLAGTLQMEVIVNNKSLNGQAIVQLEQAVGAAIRHFNNAGGVNVPRSRFLPVKSTSDLLLVKSNLFSLKHGALVMNPARMFPVAPLVKLGDQHFAKVKDFLSRFETMPNIIELDHLTVTGDVTFGKNVVLKGTVIIIANHGTRIDIPERAELENKIVSGNLRILEH